jgi:putative nucleotidyltransferase with HDIG domain
MIDKKIHCPHCGTEVSLVDKCQNCADLLEKDKLAQQYKNELREESFGSMQVRLYDINKIDNFTGGHSVRVENLSSKVAVEMGVNGVRKETLAKASILHDIGKLHTPDDILKKPGKLNEKEIQEMRKHSSQGAMICSFQPSLRHLSIIIAQHHCDWDGKNGYPPNITKENIHPLARIIRVCDAVDAMMHARIYGVAKDVDYVLSELKEYSGIQFDPEVAELFTTGRIPIA